MGYKIKSDSSHITVNFSREIAKEMIKYPEVNWSIIGRMAIEKYCNDRKAKRTTLVEHTVSETNEQNTDEK